MSVAPQNVEEGPPECDSSAVDDLSAIMSQEDLAELLSDLAVETQARLAFLESVDVSAATLKGIQIRAHDLKSMSGNFGFLLLSDRARLVENAARDGDVASTLGLLPDLLARGRAMLGLIRERCDVKDGARACG